MRQKELETRNRDISINIWYSIIWVHTRPYKSQLQSGNNVKIRKCTKFEVSIYQTSKMMSPTPNSSFEGVFIHLKIKPTIFNYLLISLLTKHLNDTFWQVAWQLSWATFSIFTIWNNLKHYLKNDLKYDFLRIKKI